METEYRNHSYVESLSGVSSDDDDDDDFLLDSMYETDDAASSTARNRANTATAIAIQNPTAVNTKQSMNIIKMLFNRERTGNFSGRSQTSQFHERAFNKVPNRLSLCLKDIVDNRCLQGHIFMGLTACGQFLLSYRVYCNDSIAANHYSFNVGYKYTLFFWVFQPHKPLRMYFQCCLFDDHGVDNVKEVTFTQWKNGNTRVLVVHGAPVDESEDSYITYVKVPKLGCLECKKQRETQECSGVFFNAHCLNCNLTVHTKYSSNETDPKFQPHINLLCPERILIIANGFMHMMRIDVDSPSAMSNTQLDSNLLNQNSTAQALMLAKEEAKHSVQQTCTEQEINFESGGQSNMVERIITDFSDIETDPGNNRHNETQKPCEGIISTVHTNTPKDIIGSNLNSTDSGRNCNTSNKETGGTVNSTIGSNNIGNKRRKHERIVTKSFRNGIVTIDLQGPTTSTNTTDKANAYEFSEDNEKCEKISIFRKRRLADKKYEFSEDNSENIIPFTKMRTAGKTVAAHSTQLYSTSSSSYTNTRNLHRFSPTAHYFHNSPCASPSSSPHTSAQSSCLNNDVLHFTSPASNLEFRSPTSCASPASSSVMRSPNRQASVAQIYNQKSPPLSQATLQMLSFKPLGALSPLQVSMTKRLELGGSMSPNAGLSFLSPRRDEPRIVEIPLQGGIIPEKPICTKKLRRRYVEEDDATSVITSEEDDCISPGYHTSLPVEVHGSCYSEMQMISQASYQRLRCTSVVITQHSFDLEAFTYYVISILCQKNQKTYNVFYDWAYEIINVCPLSQTIICLLVAHFSARDQIPSTPTNCLNCSGKLDCAFHRRQYECRILFTWNMESGEWQVLDYGELNETFELFNTLKRCGSSSLTIALQAKKVASDIFSNLKQKLPDYTSSLRILDSDIKKSKQSISDLDNMVEFYLKQRHIE